jgi:hypothetical protein
MAFEPPVVSPSAAAAVTDPTWMPVEGSAAQYG